MFFLAIIKTIIKPWYFGVFLMFCLLKVGVKFVAGIMSLTSLSMIYLYKNTLGMYFGGNCRYIPSCSDYAIMAIKRHGVIRGWLLAIKRILSCHPFSKKTMYDPVP